jgi:hypothetical protein
MREVSDNRTASIRPVRAGLRSPRPWMHPRYFLAAILLISLVSGCAAPRGWNSRSTARIRLAGLSDIASKGSRTILPSCGVRVAKANIQAVGNDGRAEQASISGSTGSIELESGEWEIHADAYASSGTLIGTGDADLTVETGSPASTIIRLAVAPGSGSCSISVALPPAADGKERTEVPAGLAVALSAASADSGTSAAFPLALAVGTGGTCTAAAKDVPSGYYLLKASLTESGFPDASSVAALLVVPGQSSTGTVALVRGAIADSGDGGVGDTAVSIAGLEPPSLTVLGLEDPFVASVPVSAKALTDPSRRVEVEWFVDGESCGMGGEMAFTDFSAGRTLRIDVVARDMDSSAVSSIDSGIARTVLASTPVSGNWTWSSTIRGSWNVQPEYPTALLPTGNPGFLAVSRDSNALQLLCRDGSGRWYEAERTDETTASKAGGTAGAIDAPYGASFVQTEANLVTVSKDSTTLALWERASSGGYKPVSGIADSRLLCGYPAVSAAGSNPAFAAVATAHSLTSRTSSDDFVSLWRLDGTAPSKTAEIGETYDGSTPRVLRKGNPFSAILSPDAGTLAVTWAKGDCLDFYSVDASGGLGALAFFHDAGNTWSPGTAVPGMAGLKGAAFSPDGRFLYCAASTSGAIHRFDLSPGSVVHGAVLTGSSGVDDLAVSDGRLVAFATASDAVSIFDRNPSDGSLAASGAFKGESTVAGLNNPLCAGISSDGSTVAVGCGVSSSKDSSAVLIFSRR